MQNGRKDWKWLHWQKQTDESWGSDLHIRLLITITISISTQAAGVIKAMIALETSKKNRSQFERMLHFVHLQRFLNIKIPPTHATMVWFLHKKLLARLWWNCSGCLVRPTPSMVIRPRISSVLHLNLVHQSVSSAKTGQDTPCNMQGLTSRYSGYPPLDRQVLR